MSDYESKYCLRGVFLNEQNIKDNNESFDEALKGVYELFKDRTKDYSGLTIKMPFDDDDGYVFNEYESNRIFIVHDGKNIGIEFIFGYEYCSIEYNSLSMSLDELDKHIGNITIAFGCKRETIKIKSYTWYNGGDEPITF